MCVGPMGLIDMKKKGVFMIIRGKEEAEHE
jgi:hypothetical protein